MVISPGAPRREWVLICVCVKQVSQTPLRTRAAKHCCHVILGIKKISMTKWVCDIWHLCALLEMHCAQQPFKQVSQTSSNCVHLCVCQVNLTTQCPGLSTAPTVVRGFPTWLKCMWVLVSLFHCFRNFSRSHIGFLSLQKLERENNTTWKMIANHFEKVFTMYQTLLYVLAFINSFNPGNLVRSELYLHFKDKRKHKEFEACPNLHG